MELSKVVEFCKVNKKKIALTIAAVASVVTLWASQNTLAFKWAQFIGDKATTEAAKVVDPAPAPAPAPAPEAK